MKKLSPIFLSIIIFTFFSACGNQDEFITSTPTIAITASPASTQISTKTYRPTQTPFLEFPNYSTKQFILYYTVTGWHGNFEIFTDDRSWPLLILYTDGQMIIPGEIYLQKIMSPEELNHFLDALEAKGFFTLESNQKHDPTDKLYDFGSEYVRIYDGSYHCIVSRSIEIERNLCVHDPQSDYLIPEMKNLINFLDSYQPDGMTLYYPDRLFVGVSNGRNPYIEDLPEEEIAWPDHLPLLETAPDSTIYAEGEMALEIYSLFDYSVSHRVFRQNDKEYTLQIMPVLPHVNLISQ